MKLLSALFAQGDSQHFVTGCSCKVHVKEGRKEGTENENLSCSLQNYSLSPLLEIYLSERNRLKSPCFMSTCSFKETNNILWCYFSVFYFVIDVEHLRREAVVASSRLTYKLMDTLNTG